MEKIFTNIYENCIWGNNNIENYKGSSGSGTTVNSESYIEFIKNFIINNKIKNIVDLGCGDFMIGDLIYNNLDINYTGYDAYNGVISYNIIKYNSISKYNFIHLDFFNKKEEIIEGDLCILRDVLMHWDINSINTFLEYIIKSKKFKYILLCNCCNQQVDNPEICTGDWRPLSANFLPLKNFNPKIVYNYLSNVLKEISIIEIIK